MGFLEKRKLAFILFSLFLILHFFKCSKHDIKKQQIKINLDLEYNGIIKNKFIDKFEHSWPVIVLDNDKKIYIPDNIYQKINIKDSIFKRKESLLIMVFRDSKIIKLSY
jgi:hypothetical protein